LCSNFGAYSDSNSHSNADVNSYTYDNAWRYTDGDSHANSHSYGDAFSDSNSDAELYTQADSNGKTTDYAPT